MHLISQQGRESIFNTVRTSAAYIHNSPGHRHWPPGSLFWCNPGALIQGDRLYLLRLLTAACSRTITISLRALGVAWYTPGFVSRGRTCLCQVRNPFNSEAGCDTPIGDLRFRNPNSLLGGGRIRQKVTCQEVAGNSQDLSRL